MDALNDQQLELLQQFVSITNWADNDVEGAVQMMQVCSWNLELAITRYYDEGPLRPNPHEPPPRPASPPPPVAPRITTPTQRTIAPRQSFLASALTSLIFFPVTLVSKIAHGAFYFFAMLFPFLPRLTGIYPANMGAARTQRRSVNPRDTAARFIREFEEEVGQNNVLPFFEGGYTQALDQAKKDLRFLIVLLQSDQHDDTTRFNRDVLASPEVTEFIRENNIMIWGGNVKESEGYQVANALTCTKFPYMVVIGYTKSTANHGAAMSIHARLQGYMSPSTLRANLAAVIARHEPTLAQIRAERSEQESARAIRAQQDSAYEASLELDRQRERERQEQERAERERIAELERQEREKQELEARREQYRKWRAEELKSKIISSDQATPQKFARISIRLTSGQRVVARFIADATVEDVYAFVDVYDLLYPEHDSPTLSSSARTLAEAVASSESASTSTNTEKNSLDRPSNYEHGYNFNLVSPMPRCILAPSSDKLIKDEKTLWPNGNLIVEEYENYDEEEI